MSKQSRYDEMEARALDFHAENQDVWRLFCEFSLELLDRGFKNYSAQHGVFARIRWETDAADANGNSIFKINNNWSAFYARWFMLAYPEHNGFYRTRTQTCREVVATDREELGPKDFDNYTAARQVQIPSRLVALPLSANKDWALKKAA